MDERRTTTPRLATRRLPASLAVALVAFVLASPAAAQQERVGRIERIAQLLRAPEPIAITTASDAVQIRRGSDGVWVPVGPDENLLMRDNLRVQRYVNVRLHVDRPAHRGWLTFLPEVLLEDGGRVFDVGEIDREAHYFIPADTTARSEVAVTIESGALLVDWRAGRLRINAAGHDVLITHTMVLFTLDANGDAGWFFVADGAVTLPAFNGLVVRAGEVARLQRGVPPVISEASAPRQRAYRTAANYNANQVWPRPRPFWARPAFYIPALGVVAGATVFAVTQSGSDRDSGPPRGTVIIRIPF